MDRLWGAAEPPGGSALALVRVHYGVLSARTDRVDTAAGAPRRVGPLGEASVVGKSLRGLRSGPNPAATQTRRPMSMSSWRKRARYWPVGLGGGTRSRAGSRERFTGRTRKSGRLRYSGT
jgi:hypothetical protein